MKKIKKIDLSFLDKDKVEAEYRKDKAKYISNYKVETFFGGKYDAVQGEAEWNNLFPMGVDDWFWDKKKPTILGLVKAYQKINEIIDILNKPKTK